MSQTEVIYQQDGAIGRISFRSPDGVNLLSTPMMAALEARLDEIAREGAIRALIFTGEGRTFLAGADVSEMVNAPGDAGRAFSRRGQACMKKIAGFHQAVTIAAINGAALGGGCELALACDLRVAAEDARIGFPEVRLGLIPGWGGTQRALQLLGPAKLRRLLFTGEHITGLAAAEIGMVNESAATTKVVALAERLARQVLASGPSAIRLAKQVLYEAESAWLERGLAGEAEAFGEAFFGGECREGLRAFLEKRSPSWSEQIKQPTSEAAAPVTGG